MTALAGSGSQNIFQAGQTGVSNGYTISSNGSALTHQWYAGSGEAARIDSSGRIGIGTSSPTVELDVTGDARLRSTSTSDGPILQFDGAGPNGTSYTFGKIEADNTGSNGAGELRFYTSLASTGGLAQRMVIARDGNVGIGTTSPAHGPLHVHSSTTDAYFHLTNSTTGSAGSDGFSLHVSGNDTVFNQRESANMRFFTANTERMRIDQSGRTAVYSTEEVLSARSSQAAGTSYWAFQVLHSATSTTTGTSSFIVYTNGDAKNTNNSYGAISDARLKENIVDASSQWDDIKELRVRNYNFIEGQTHTQIGVIAQEVETVSPGLVTESPDRDDEGNDLGTTTKSVNYSVLYMKAVKALQEAMDRIETLETKVAALEAG